MAVFSGLVVSVDAFFIGISLGLQKRCRFLYLAIINLFLFGLCILGFLLAGQLYEHIPFDPDLIVGFAFIALGLWTILHFFISEHIKRRREATFALVGIVMSGEAMLITMGITLIFLPDSGWAIPITVAVAHFGYSALAFYLARTKHVRPYYIWDDGAFCIGAV
jgi:putative Mn2+ efflux pump MntP